MNEINNEEATRRTKLSGRSAAMIVGLCSLAYFISYFSRKDFAAALAGMLNDGIIDKLGGGYIGMGMFIAYGVGQLISGYLGDRIKPAMLLMMGLFTTAVCNLAMPLIPGWAMIPVWTLNGLAQAMLWPPIVRLLSDSLDNESFVRANLIVTSAAHIATVLLYVYVPVCLSFMSWHAVFYTAGVLAFLGFISVMTLLCAVLRKAGCSGGAKKTAIGKSGGYIALLRGSGILPILAAIVMMGFLRDGIESWLPTLYCEAFGRDPSESTLLSAILPVFSIASISLITLLHKTPLFGNEVKGAAVTFAVSALLGVPLFFLIEMSAVWSRLVCLLLVALITAMMHACNFLLISCLPGRFAVYGRAATTSGVTNAFVYVGAAVSMYGIALVAELCGWQVTVGSWLAVASAGLVFALIALPRYTAFLQGGEGEQKTR